jgi:hypothetical protein
MAGEPDWMIEAALRRKRQELARLWEEREAALRKAREKERQEEEKAAMGLHGRSVKRARVDDGEYGKRKKGEIDEEREFLVGDWADGTVTGDGLAGLSKETRELMAKVGLGGAQGKEGEEDCSLIEEEVKVRDRVDAKHLRHRLTHGIDLLYLPHTLANRTVYRRTSKTSLSYLHSRGHVVHRQSRKRPANRTSQASPLIFTAEALHQPICSTAQLPLRDQRPVYRTSARQIRTQMPLYPQRRQPKASARIP